MLYNDKIERIRANEQAKRKNPAPIKFEVFESFQNKATLRRIVLKCENAQHTFDLDTTKQKGKLY